MDVIASCLMLQVPEELSAKILEWAKANIKEEDLYNKEGKGLQKGHHITLAPQITDDAADQHIMQVINNTPALSVDMGPVGFFIDPDKDYHVLKIAIDPANLEAVREKVIEGIGMYNPTHEFNPHITIAYVNPGACQDLDGADIFQGQSCPIYSCIYSGSEGGNKAMNLQAKPKPELSQDESEMPVQTVRDMIMAKLSTKLSSINP